MKLTPTIVVEIGALIAVAGALLLTTIQLSPTEVVFLRAFAAILIGFFLVQIGYVQSIREKITGKLDARHVPPDKRE